MPPSASRRVGAQYHRWRYSKSGALAGLAFSAVTVPIGKLPSPGSEPERVFTSSQPAIADEILGIERRCFTASLPAPAPDPVANDVPKPA